MLVILLILVCLFVVAALGYASSKDKAHPAAEPLLDDDLREQAKQFNEQHEETGRKKVFKAIIRAYYRITGT
jgi:hypothetical protein